MLLVASGLQLTSLAPADAGRGHDHPVGPDRIELPDGWRPEGITTDGRRLYVGSLADGAIWAADPRSGDGEVLAEGTPGRVAVGVDYDRRRDAIWVAGGATGEVRAHDADTGALLATYSFPSPDATPRFLNDVTVTRRAVYVTDSRHAELAVVPLGRPHHRGHGSGHGSGLPPADAARVLPLTGDLVLQEGNNLNGIVDLGHWLVAVQSNAGKLLRISPRTGETTQVDLGGASLVNGDGLEPGREGIYVLRNRDNLIVPVRLNRRATEGTVRTAFTDAGLDVPSTAARLHHSLYAVNARFTTTPTPTTPYWITRVDLR
jgi:DNA-binding beta-propeller fold protein YncE